MKCSGCREEIKPGQSYSSPKNYCKTCFSKRTNAIHHERKSDEAYVLRRRETIREWHKNNISKGRAHRANSAAKRRGAEGSFTKDEFLKLCKAWGWLCVYCGRELSEHTVVREHVIPLHHGGDNTIHNILPSCAECNSSKGHKSLGQWLRERYGWPLSK